MGSHPQPEQHRRQHLIGCGLGVGSGGNVRVAGVAPAGYLATPISDELYVGVIFNAPYAQHDLTRTLGALLTVFFPQRLCNSFNQTDDRVPDLKRIKPMLDFVFGGACFLLEIMYSNLNDAVYCFSFSLRQREEAVRKS